MQVEEAHDPITGEVLPRAADGHALFPVASLFSQFLASLERGQLDRDLAVRAGELIDALRDEFEATKAKAKGEIVLKLGISLEDGEAFMITSDVKVKLPAEKRPRSVMWATDDGRFSPTPPRQSEMFGIRAVPASGPVRNV